AVQPFRRDGEWTVILAVTQSVARKWTAESLSLIDDVVARVWPLVQRARVDRELHESEAFLQSIIGATADCIKVLNANGEIQWMSENGQRLLEISDFSPVKNRVWADCFPDPATARQAREAVQTAQHGAIGRLRGLCPTFAGNLKWWDVIMSPIKGTDGQPVQILSVARDVTSLREVEDALHASQEALEQHAQTLEARLEELRIAKAESESAARDVAESAERLRLLSEVVSLQVWTAAADGKVDFANQEAVTYLGAELDEIQGERWMRFVHPEDLPEASASWRRSLANGTRYESKFRLRNKAGTYRWFLARAEALRDSYGRVIKWFGSNTDIDGLKSAQDAAERASRSKDDFLAALSHELRTPLTPVLMTAASLRDDERLPADVREQLGMIERNIELEARLIDDLLDLTTVSHGKLQLRAERCNAHALINLAVEIVQEEAVSKHIVIERAFAATGVSLMADPARFQQVVWNLLRNSVKFTPERGNIVVSTQNEIGPDGAWWLRIEVLDTGIGIDPSRLEQIFRPFEQGDLRGGHRFGGLGLGLAIARAVVDLHGGTIKAESSGQDCGARFIVRLPGASPHDIAVPAIRKITGTMSRSGERERPPVPRALPMRLLLVEDDDSSLETFSRLLRRDGHDVVPVSTVVDALAAANSGTFDLVISDIGLPDGTGIELMEQLRRKHGLRGVALSGYGMEEDVARTRQAGFVTHLIKPIQIAELRRVLASLGPT
ncbi:MAG TPA: ATP-binding protein, partial [Opitutus sp.]|nr:ATP-binding protein [Opitutus sp.]